MAVKSGTRNGDTAAQQIATLQRLKPQAAAWLANTSLSTLRDSVADIQPAESGVFNAREVAKWASSRVRDEILTDDECEIVLRSGEDLAGMLNEREAIALRRVGEIVDRYGVEVSKTILRLLIAEAEDLSNPPTELPPMDRTVRLCEHCGRMRRGRSWIKPKRTYSNAEIRTVECPSCEL